MRAGSANVVRGNIEAGQKADQTNPELAENSRSGRAGPIDAIARKATGKSKVPKRAQADAKG